MNEGLIHEDHTSRDRHSLRCVSRRKTGTSNNFGFIIGYLISGGGLFFITNASLTA